MRYLPFGDRVISQMELDVPSELQGYCLDLYRRTREAYEEAGCPLGPSDEAMLIWFTFDHQASSRARQIHCN